MEWEIDGQIVQVIYREPADDRGNYCHKSFTAEINNDLKGEEKLRVELHEFVHAFVDIMGWHDVFESQAEELLCNQLIRQIMKNYTLTPKGRSLE